MEFAHSFYRRTPIVTIGSIRLPSGQLVSGYQPPFGKSLDGWRMESLRSGSHACSIEITPREGDDPFLTPMNVFVDDMRELCERVEFNSR